MVKLSTAQQKVLDKGKSEIDRARQYGTYEEYFIAVEAGHWGPQYNTPEKFKMRDIDKWNIYKGYWEREKIGIVLTQCNSRTIQRLQELGYIEIIKDSKGQLHGIDRVKILNY